MGNYIKAYGVKKHNLKNIDICIPKGKLTTITGVSGSGKSSLITHTLVPKLKMLIRNHVIQNEDEDIYYYKRELNDGEIHGIE